jgi:hypothetical protein
MLGGVAHVLVQINNPMFGPPLAGLLAHGGHVQVGGVN